MNIPVETPPPDNSLPPPVPVDICTANDAPAAPAPAGDPKADAIIRRHVIWSLSAGLIPVPLADIAAVTAIQIDALKQLAAHYGVNCPEDSGKTFVAALSGGTMARLGASAVKAIPGVGTVIGGLTMSAMSAASTYAICQVAARQFRTGTDLVTENVDRAKEAYREALEKGKKFVQQLKERGADKIAEETSATIRELENLRDKGVLTPEEFETKKAAVLAKADTPVTLPD